MWPKSDRVRLFRRGSYTLLHLVKVEACRKSYPESLSVLLSLAMRAFLALLIALLSTAAFAHGRTSVGVYVGPAWGPWYYPPYYYPPPVVVLPPAPPPPVYVEQAPAAPQNNNYWYYCPTNNGYYPYVKECPAGWLKVLPETPR